MTETGKAEEEKKTGKLDYRGEKERTWFGSVNSGVGTVFNWSVIVVCGSLCGLGAFSPLQCGRRWNSQALHTSCEISLLAPSLSGRGDGEENRSSKLASLMRPCGSAKSSFCLSADCTGCLKSPLGSVARSSAVWLLS